MKVIDFVIIFVLILGAFRGFQKGFVMEVFGIVAFFLGIAGGLYLTPFLSDLLSSIFENSPGLARIISFIIIFVVIVVMVNIVGVAIKRTIDLTLLSSFDQMAGSVIGLIMWTITLSFLLWFLGFFGARLSKEYTDGSLLYPFVANLAPWMIDTVSIMTPFVKEFFDSLRPGEVPQERQAMNSIQALMLKKYC